VDNFSTHFTYNPGQSALALSHLRHGHLDLDPVSVHQPRRVDCLARDRLRADAPDRLGRHGLAGAG
jgi:hypothetical protein